MDKEAAQGAPPEALILASTSRYRAELMSRLGLHLRLNRWPSMNPVIPVRRRWPSRDGYQSRKPVPSLTTVVILPA